MNFRINFREGGGVRFGGGGGGGGQDGCERRLEVFVKIQKIIFWGVGSGWGGGGGGQGGRVTISKKGLYF